MRKTFVFLFIFLGQILNQSFAASCLDLFRVITLSDDTFFQGDLAKYNSVSTTDSIRSAVNHILKNNPIDSLYWTQQESLAAIKLYHPDFNSVKSVIDLLEGPEITGIKGIKTCQLLSIVGATAGMSIQTWKSDSPAIYLQEQVENIQDAMMRKSRTEKVLQFLPSSALAIMLIGVCPKLEKKKIEGLRMLNRETIVELYQSVNDQLIEAIKSD
jgi:hypothetical protein